MSNVFRILLIASAILTVSAVPVFSMTARAAMDVPVWHVGDYWVYDLVGAGFLFPGANGSVRYEVVGTQNVTVGGTPYPSYHSNFTLIIVAGSVMLTIPGESWFRTSDLAPVKTVETISFGTITETITVTYNPPLTMQWPLTARAQWSVSSVVTTVLEITGQPPQTQISSLAATLRVDADESRTVPAGTFTTTPVMQTDSATGTYQRSYWSRDAGNSADQRTYAANNTEMGSMKLKSYRYTAPGTGGGGILGLPPFLWAVILLVVLVAVIGAVMIRRRRPVAPTVFPPGTWPPPQAPPMPPSQPGGPPPPPP